MRTFLNLYALIATLAAIGLYIVTGTYTDSLAIVVSYLLMEGSYHGGRYDGSRPGRYDHLADVVKRHGYARTVREALKMGYGEADARELVTLIADAAVPVGTV